MRAFLSSLPLSICTTLIPKKKNFKIFVRNTLCKSATASILSFANALDNFKSPKMPLCFPFKSGENTVTFGKSLKNGLKKPLVKTVIFTLGYCCVKALKTGIVIATSPIAERRITNICFIVLGISTSLEEFLK